MSRSKSHEIVLSLCKAGRLNETLNFLLTSEPPLMLGLPTSAYSSIIQMCIDRSSKKEGILVHEHLKRVGYPSDLCLDNKLIIFYLKIRDVSNARQVFDGMHRKSVVSWTAMISAYSQNGLPEEAIDVFSLMRRCGFYPNQFTFGSVFRACTNMCCLRIGNQVHGCAHKSGFIENIFVQAAVVDLNGKCGSIVDARLMFDEMAVRDLVSWNTMIGGYASTQDSALESFRLFGEMLNTGACFDDFTLSTLLKACGKKHRVLEAAVCQIHALIIKLGFQTDNIVSGALINAYAKSTNMVSAELVYKSMQDADLVALTTLITGYSQENRGSAAVDLFVQERNRNVSDDVMMCSLVGACTDSNVNNGMWLGRQIHGWSVKSHQPKSDSALANALVDMYAKTGEIEDARRCFDEMKSKNVISWTCMINGYGKHGYGEDAMALFETMEQVPGVKPNDVTFLSLLSACSHTSGMTERGCSLFSNMVGKYGIRPRAEHYSCVVDLLGRGGKLEEAYDFACTIDDMGKLNSSVWGALLGSCRLDSNMLLGKMAAEHLFHLDPNNSANYIVLANIYAEAALWDESWRIRRLMEQKCPQKDSAWSYLLPLKMN
ncbi:putative Pentatricopeptide repeat-containing protein [Zostera marina]|uniref:Putative Pentatricopeptide repeat-containing protein n=1 Tax=Zostera marina TaxID=29655 RepID=A0A0K9PRH3_ZOSMR|nr:putative Pentatricopeptide repeat-containing protein [Zostera marina]